MAREQAHIEAGHSDGGSSEDLTGIVPQLQPTPGLPERMAVRRRKDRVMRILHTLPVAAQQAIVESMTPQERAHYNVGTVHAGNTMPNAAETTSVMPPLGGRRPSPTPRNYQEPTAGFQGRLPG